MWKLAWVALFTLVICSLGEQSLRGRPSSSSLLATEDSARPRPDVERPSRNNFKSLVSKAKRILHLSDPADVDFRPQDLVDLKSAALMDESEIVMSFLSWLIFYSFFAWYYHKYVLYFVPINEGNAEEEKKNNYVSFQKFRSELWQCADQPDICFWSCCCPGIRWADTMSKLGIQSFWSAFWLLTLLYCLMFIPIATPLCWLVIVFYMTYHRQEFRRLFKFDDYGGATWVTDCLSYCCCMCCTVAQEARQCGEAVSVVHFAINPATPRAPDIFKRDLHDDDD